MPPFDATNQATQDLASIGSLLFPDPSKAAHAYYYGAEGRKALQDAYVQEGQQNALARTTQAPFRPGGQVEPPTYRMSPLQNSNMVIMNAPVNLGVPTAQDPAAAGGSPVSTMFNNLNARTATPLPPAISPTPEAGPAPTTTGSDGSTPGVQTRFVPDSFPDANGGPKNAGPAVHDGSPAQPPFNLSQTVAMATAAGLDPAKVQNIGQAGIGQGMLTGQIPIPLGNRILGAAGAPQMAVADIGAAAEIRKQQIAEAGALARTVQGQTGAFGTFIGPDGQLHYTTAGQAQNQYTPVPAGSDAFTAQQQAQLVGRPSSTAAPGEAPTPGSFEDLRARQARLPAPAVQGEEIYKRQQIEAKLDSAAYSKPQNPVVPLGITNDRALDPAAAVAVSRRQREILQQYPNMDWGSARQAALEDLQHNPDKATGKVLPTPEQVDAASQEGFRSRLWGAGDPRVKTLTQPGLPAADYMIVKLVNPGDPAYTPPGTTAGKAAPGKGAAATGTPAGAPAGATTGTPAAVRARVGAQEVPPVSQTVSGAASAIAQSLRDAAARGAPVEPSTPVPGAPPMAPSLFGARVAPAPTAATASTGAVVSGATAAPAPGSAGRALAGGYTGATPTPAPAQPAVSAPASPTLMPGRPAVAPANQPGVGATSIALAKPGQDLGPAPPNLFDGQTGQVRATGQRFIIQNGRMVAR